MEDIARLSKEANLAYYEQVLCKSIIQKFLFFFQGERHLPAPGPLHSAVWSAQHQWCPHEAKTGMSMLLPLAHPPCSSLSWSKYSSLYSLCKSLWGWNWSVLAFVQTAFCILNMIQIFTFLSMFILKLTNSDPGEILQAPAGGYVQEARLSSARLLSGHTLKCLDNWLDMSGDVWTSLYISYLTSLDKFWHVLKYLDMYDVDCTELLQNCCNHLWSLQTPYAYYTLKEVSSKYFFYFM